jgi:hypothetical protein
MRIEGIYFDTLLMALLHEAGTGRAG